MKRLLVILLGALALPVQVAAETLLVAAASDLTHSMDALAAAFAREVPGAELKVSLGSSGNFFAQIKQGAPFDVFLAADMQYPARLAQEGAADASTLTQYAIGRVAIWSLDRKLDLSQGMRILNHPAVKRVAIANPDVAPYGRAARAALQQHGFWDAVQGKLVIGENIAQTAQFVQTGNAQLGIVSYATVRAPQLKGVGSHYLIPDTGVPPIEQGAIITRHGKDKPLAARFLKFLTSPAAQDILLRAGFTLPRAKNA
ncbi:MAG: molybdate ABC transporter substrate-binding protein [Pseudomonadota bacterium]